MKKPKMPKENPAVGRARDRQVEELAKLDEEENERLKNAFANRRGVRAFRGRSGSGRGTASSGAASRGPAGGGTNSGGTGGGTRAFMPASR